MEEFFVKIDQSNLKYQLEQKIYIALQHRSLSRLLDLNYKIDYKRGVKNKIADALLR
jgi:uncharacterized lipoprotein YajG